MDHIFTEDDLLSYVHGVAPDEIATRIEARMERDADFRAEIAVMRSLKPALAGEGGQNSPGEFGWHRLQAAVEREDTHASRPGIAQRLGGWRAAAAVLGIIVMGQAVYITTGTTGPAQYHTASGVADRYVLAARFAENAAMAEIGTMIRELDGRIIDGPSATGFYRLSFDSEKAMHAAETHLEKSSLITLLAVE